MYVCTQGPYRQSYQTLHAGGCGEISEDGTLPRTPGPNADQNQNQKGGKPRFCHASPFDLSKKSGLYHSSRIRVLEKHWFIINVVPKESTKKSILNFFNKVHMTKRCS
jgi:hypothetical protein